MDLALLADITRAAGGAAGPGRTDVANANTARHAAELWEPGRPAPGGGPRAVRPRRPRAQPVQLPKLADRGTQPPQIRVIMVDFTGQQKIAEAAA